MSTIEIGLVGAPLESFGHPGACSEPAPGVVDGDSSVTIDGTPLATESDSSLEFSTHGHDVLLGVCISKSAHSIQQTNVSETVFVNGNAVYGAVPEAAEDPGSGGSVDYVDSGGNTTVTITEPE